MKNKLIGRPVLFWIGVAVAIILFASYFMTLPGDSGDNYNVDTSLLGIIIFYNPWILAFYLIIAVVLVWFGIAR
ncbi:MAG: hypothetical protein WCK90_04010 [archaeon]